MFTYLHILVDQNDWQATCHVPEDLACFQGHFPNNPVLPAIAQLDMLSGFVSEVRGALYTIEEASSLKFMHPVLPNDKVLITLTVRDGDIHFRIACDGKLVSRGQLSFREVI